MTPGPFSIGSKVWPGISKLIEESSEVGQVCGKLIGSGGDVNHFDGTNLRQRLEEEMGDTLAALWFVMDNNELSNADIYGRAERKLEVFTTWHMEGLKG